MNNVTNNPPAPIFAFDNTYARKLEGFYVPWKAAQAAQPRLVQLNRELAEELGLDADALDSEEGARIFAGNLRPPRGRCRSLKPTPATSSGASFPNLATGGRCSWAR